MTMIGDCMPCIVPEFTREPPGTCFGVEKSDRRGRSTDTRQGGAREEGGRPGFFFDLFFFMTFPLLMTKSQQRRSPWSDGPHLPRSDIIDTRV